MSEGWFVYAELLSIIRLIFYVFYENCVNLIMGGVNYRTLGMLEFDKFWNQTATASIIWVQLVSALWHWIGTC